MEGRGKLEKAKDGEGDGGGGEGGGGEGGGDGDGEGGGGDGKSGGGGAGRPRLQAARSQICPAVRIWTNFDTARKFHRDPQIPHADSSGIVLIN